MEQVGATSVVVVHVGLLHDPSTPVFNPAFAELHRDLNGRPWPHVEILGNQTMSSSCRVRADVFQRGSLEEATWKTVFGGK